MSRHLVLGGGGFLGSWLCKRLIGRGNEVTAVDVTFPSFRKEQYSDSYPGFFGDEVMKVQADLRKPGRARSVIDQSHPEFVWQLAADMGGVEYFHSDKDWQAAVNNQMINTNVMAAVAQFAPSARVIFTSTACALATEKQTHAYKSYYDKGTSLTHSEYTWPLTEEDILWGTPDQLYGQEKRNSAILWNSAPMDTRVAFLHTIYGPYQEHAGIRMKFPSAVAQKARKARETGRIELLGDGRQVRTYLYVEDAIDRLLALGNSESDPGFVNIGGVVPYTVDEVARIALDAAGADLVEPQVELVHVAGPTGVEARAVDMTKFNTAFPQFGRAFVESRDDKMDVSLEAGMGKFIKWLDEVDG